MSNAAMHQPIQKSDFPHTESKKGSGLRAPTLPSLVDGVDEDEVGDNENGKVQPINISMLKEYMLKKIAASKNGKNEKKERGILPKSPAITPVTNNRPFEVAPTSQ